MSLKSWVALGAWSCVVLACSGGSSNAGSRGRSNIENPASPVINGTGAAGSRGPGVSTTSGGAVIPGSPGTATNATPPPPVDSSAGPFAQDDTAQAGIEPAMLDMLRNASAPCAVTVTHPYEGTMFPGGLIPPVIMWDGAAEAAYLRFAYEGSDKVHYEYAAKVSAPASIQIPRDAWNEITRRTNYLSLNVTLNTVSGGVAGSCQLHWKIAPGNMVGALYYNTYQAPPPGVLGQGAVMRQSLGAQAEIYKQFQGPINAIPMTGPCYSCHSVSFNGSTLVASYHDYSGQKFTVEKFDITQDLQPEPKGLLDNANFGALTPDGKKILTMGNPQCTAGSDTFPRKPNNFPLVEGPAHARLLDTSTGADLNATGLTHEHYMWMPQFSPDGTKVVFVHAKPDGMGGSDRRELATMDFDNTTNAFSNLKVIVNTSSLPGVPTPSLPYAPGPAFGGVLACGAEMCGPDGMPNTCMSAGNGMQGGAIPGLGGAIPGIPGDVGALAAGSCEGPCYPSWPFFTPDGKAVVYALTSEPDYSSAFPGRDLAANSELWYVDLELNQTIRMDNANRGLAEIDAQSNYFPTVMPVAVGGYFWVFWSSMRAYGNRFPGREPGVPTIAAVEAIKKRIWAAAIKPKKPLVENDDPTLVDPSTPGFYLEGQSESGNVRAFAALNPCLADGASCTSGLDCCCGYCLQSGASTSGTCSCEVPMCAKVNEKCTKDADCCPPESPDQPVLQCLGGYCGFIQLN